MDLLWSGIGYGLIHGMFDSTQADYGLMHESMTLFNPPSLTSG
jgi:hypothetical protein